MSQPSTPIILSPAEFADTGQWRLIIYISHSGMTALLRHASDPQRPIVRMFDATWPLPDSPAGGASLLKRIENTVYDHPGVLDDYATDIIIESPHATWVPTAVIESAAGEDPEQQVFHSLFPGVEGDICTDRLGDITALYSLSPGLEAFLGRTLPGARMRLHLGVLAEGVPAMLGDRPAVAAAFRDNGFDLLAFGTDGRMLSASARSAANDPCADILKAMQVLGLAEGSADIILCGNHPSREGCRIMLEARGLAPKTLDIPGTAAPTSLPTAAALLAFRHRPAASTGPEPAADATGNDHNQI